MNIKQYIDETIERKVHQMLDFTVEPAVVAGPVRTARPARKVARRRSKIDTSKVEGKKLYSLSDAAVLVGASRPTVYQAAARGALKTQKSPKGTKMVVGTELTRYFTR